MVLKALTTSINNAAKSSSLTSSYSSMPSSYSSSTRSRPLPLKQRTSSKDTRRDYSTYTWRSLLVLIKLREYFVTVDNFSLWRRHLIFAIQDGDVLRKYMVQRFSSNMVFMSLMLSAELGVLFNSAEITTNVRYQLSIGAHTNVSFWAGFMIIVSALLTLLSLISTFTAWAMVNAVDEVNVHAVFRSSIGQYAAELPGRFIVCSVYSFLISFLLFFFILLPIGIWSAALLTTAVILFIHVVSSFSAFGRVIMHSGAMGHNRIFDTEYEMSLLPHNLHNQLLNKAKANLSQQTSITRQYRRKHIPLKRYYTEEELIDQIKNSYNNNGGMSTSFDENNENDGEGNNNNGVPLYRRRADSLVRFADEELGESDAIFYPSGLSSYGSSSSFNNNSHVRTLTPTSDVSSDDATPIATTRKDLGKHNRINSGSGSSNTRIRPPTPIATNIKGMNSNNNNTPTPPHTHIQHRRSASPAGSTGSTDRPNSLGRKPPLPSSSRSSTSSPMFFNTTGSTSSLEQWLQASPTVSNHKDMNITNSNEVADSDVSSPAIPSLPPPPPPLPQHPPTMPPPTVVTTWRDSSITSSLGDGRDGGSTDITTPGSSGGGGGGGVKSILIGVLSDREEEQFANDYGDITDDDFLPEDIEDLKRRKRPQGLQIDEDEDEIQVGGDRMDDSNEQETEFTSLLQHGTRNNNHTLYTESERTAQASSSARHSQSTPTNTSRK